MNEGFNWKSAFIQYHSHGRRAYRRKGDGEVEGGINDEHIYVIAEVNSECKARLKGNEKATLSSYGRANDLWVHGVHLQGVDVEDMEFTNMFVPRQVHRKNVNKRVLKVDGKLLEIELLSKRPLETIRELGE